MAVLNQKSLLRLLAAAWLLVALWLLSKDGGVALLFGVLAGMVWATTLGKE